MTHEDEGVSPAEQAMEPEPNDAEVGGADASATPGTDDAPAGVRLQKVLAAAGIASRRASEELIAAGRVRVNGVVVTEQGRRIDPVHDRVEVDRIPVQVDVAKRYVILNKPVGVVSSLHDENDRTDLSRFTRQYAERLYNVGRLDQATSGLLLLTNDGELAHVLMHPSFGVEKTYIARVRGHVTAQTLARLTSGIDLDDGPIAADKVRLLQHGHAESLLEVTLHSGRNRIVRRMLAAVEHPVLGLVRRAFGPLTLGTLTAGATRDATRAEIGALLALVREAHELTDRGPDDTAARPAKATPVTPPRESAAPGVGEPGDTDSDADAGSEAGRQAEPKGARGEYRGRGGERRPKERPEAHRTRRDDRESGENGHGGGRQRDRAAGSRGASGGKRSHGNGHSTAPGSDQASGSARGGRGAGPRRDGGPRPSGPNRRPRKP